MSPPDFIYEYGTMTFAARKPVVYVDLDEDGAVTIHWRETADDHHGSVERQVHFTWAEFQQIIALRDQEGMSGT